MLSCAPAHADEPSPAAVPPAAAASAASPHWEGVIGYTGALQSSRLGDSGARYKGQPAFYLRYGRLTITNTSGFVSRRSDDVVRGLGVDMVSTDTVRLGLGLRYDSGRAENADPALQGLGNIPPTLRLRLQASTRLKGPWRLGASWNIDMLGRGGGGFGDVTAAWDHALASDTLLTLGSSLNLADRRYMQSRFGITDEQSARSVYRPYRAHAGLRDLSTFANLRHDIGHDWTLLTGVGLSRRLGSAADSPLTHNRNGWSLNAAGGWRF